MNTPTVGETSGFKARDIHTKFATKPLNPNLVRVKGMEGVISRSLAIAMNMTIIEGKLIDPQECKKCGAPMQLKVRQKANIELGIPAKVGYTCNRANTGCQNAKAKKHINSQKVKAWLNRTPPPKAKKVVGVQLKDAMIHA
jgi:hypothetical protein